MQFLKRCSSVRRVVSVGALALVAFAGCAQVPNLVISPANPAPGEAFTVSGACFGVSPETGEIVVGDRVDVFLLDHPVEDPGQAYDEFLQKTTAIPAANTTWSASLQVPNDAEPGQQFFVVTQCLHRFSFVYQTAAFGVGVGSP